MLRTTRVFVLVGIMIGAMLGFQLYGELTQKPQSERLGNFVIFATGAIAHFIGTYERKKEQEDDSDD